MGRSHNSKKEKCNIAFSPEGFQNQQKEALFTALLKNHLISNGNLVAEPSPDFGDDLWFCRADAIKLRRGQVKSAHSCYINSPNITANIPVERQTRRYSFSLQRNNLRRWMKEEGYVYFFAMADERFHGLAEGQICDDQNGCILRIDPTRLIEPPPSVRFMGTKTTQRSGTVHSHRAPTKGFHFGCVPCVAFENYVPMSEVTETARFSLEMTIQTHSDDRGILFTYCLFSEDVTRYFGQTDRGLNHG